MVHMISSAKGVLALLRESDNAILLFALKRLVDLMDTFWCEIASDLPLVEELNESASLTEETRKLAALVASQVYFHLGAFDESVHYALAAGNAFDGTKRSLFTDTILSRCIDLYVENQERREAAESAAVVGANNTTTAADAAGGGGGGVGSSDAASVAAVGSPVTNNTNANANTNTNAATVAPELDPRLEELFVSLTRAWIIENESLAQVKEIVGFTIRARRLDFLERVLKQCLANTHSADILNFTFHVANVLLRDITFRRKVLRLLAGLYTESLATIDFLAMAQCLLFLGDVKGTAILIQGLVKGGDDMMALQLAFDLFQYGNQEFLTDLTAALGPPPAMGTVAAAGAAAEGNSSEDAKVAEVTAEGEAIVAATSAAPAPVAAKDDSVEGKILKILSGRVTTQLHVKFLYSRCAADIHVLNQIKKKIDPKRSVVHIAAIIANALMYCGTTIDAFLRDNMAWMGKAEHWAKFITTASLGVIHRGNTAQAMQLLEPYLPKGTNVPPLPYQEAGALYALGLIHAPLGTSSDDRSVVDYLAEQVRQFSGNVQLTHGASLGLGLAAMGLQDEDLCDSLFTCAVGSDAVGGEGAALAMGLLMMGSGNEEVTRNLKNMASEETQKEKIIRGAMMGVALVNLGRENEALGLATELLASGDPWVRLGGCYVLGLAFAGTESSLAIERLLQVTVRDTSDDVRRNAAIMIGLLTFKNPALCLDLTKILVDSYNPHIRYGVAMALGVAAAGTGRADIIDVLWEMKDDLVDFVRQGVYVALALVMAQLTETENGKVKEFRVLIDGKVGDRKEDICTKFGCIIAAGLLDAGGRNCTFAMHHDRHRLDKAVVGMFLFTQHWYWYPYALMVSLAVQPTCFIGLNEGLEMPEYEFRSNAKPSTFAVPKSVLQEKKEIKALGVQAVVLSTTRKEEALQRKRGKQAGDAAAAEAAGGGADGKDKAETDAAAAAAGAAAAAAPAEESEPVSEMLHNPARVTARQQSVVEHTCDARYVPLKATAAGVCMLRDTRPDLGDQKMVEAIVLGADQDAPAPEPFSYP